MRESSQPLNIHHSATSFLNHVPVTRQYAMNLTEGRWSRSIFCSPEVTTGIGKDDSGSENLFRCSWMSQARHATFLTAEEIKTKEIRSSKLHYLS